MFGKDHVRNIQITGKKHTIQSLKLQNHTFNTGWYAKKGNDVPLRNQLKSIVKNKSVERARSLTKDERQKSNKITKNTK